MRDRLRGHHVLPEPCRVLVCFHLILCDSEGGMYGGQKTVFGSWGSLMTSREGLSSPFCCPYSHLPSPRASGPSSVCLPSHFRSAVRSIDVYPPSGFLPGFQRANLGHLACVTSPLPDETCLDGFHGKMVLVALRHRIIQQLCRTV